MRPLGAAPGDQDGLNFNFTTDADRNGTGLGLAIVQSGARAHGGTVELASQPGRGACFTLRLPRR